MGLHDLCTQCQQLCHSRLAPVNVEDIRYVSKGDKYYAFRQANSKFVWPSEGQLLSMKELIRIVSHENPKTKLFGIIKKLKELTRQFWRQDTASTDDIDDAPIVVNYSINVLRDGIADGCHLCSLIFINIEQQGKFEDRLGTSLGIPVLRLAGADSGATLDDPYLNIATLEINFYEAGYWDDNIPYLEAESLTSIFVQLDISSISSLPRSVISSNDEMMHGFRRRTIEQTREWIHRCRHEHDRCRKSNPDENAHSSSELPTRLLEIDMQAGEFRVRLIDSLLRLGDSFTGLSYATLSHCWGFRGVSAKLLLSNIDGYRKQMTFSELPRTFREAITFCYLLGVRYLWIDALCIIQDDDRDWQREFPRMDTVYAGAFVNIAASASTDCHGGLLVQENLRTPCYIKTAWSSSQSSLDLIIGFESFDFKDSVMDAPLNHRGWVFQERLLSARTVQFCRDQIWLHCPSSTHGECFGIDHSPYYDKGHRMTIGSIHWERLITAYSQTRLTRHSDRLAAISGVAQAYLLSHNLKPDDYVAGMLRPHLIDGLCWSAPRLSQGKIFHGSPRSGVAPTWSWASTCSGTKIFWEHQWASGGCEAESHPDFQMLDVIMLHSDLGTPFDHKIEGTLRVRGVIASIQILKSPLFYLDKHKTDQGFIRLAMDDLVTELEGSHFRLLPVRKRPESGEDGDNVVHSYSYSGILLQRVPGKQGTYERVGFARAYLKVERGVPSWWHKTCDLRPDDFVEALSDGVHIIDIV